MSDEDLPEIVVPDDALATRNLPAPTAPCLSAGDAEPVTVVWVLETGSRHFWRPEVVRVAFDAIEADYGWRGPGPYTFRLIHGACPLRPVKVDGREVDASADMLADAEARRRPNWEVVESSPGVAGFPAAWGRGAAAGPIRNAQMVKYLLAQDGPKEVVGFPLIATTRHPKGTTSGTKGCLDLADKAGLRWWVAPLDMDTTDLRQEAA